jgi:hypothetical protein
VPTTVANSQDNHPSHVHNFPSVAEEEEESDKDLPSSGASGQDRTCLCSMQSIHEEEEYDEEWLRNGLDKHLSHGHDISGGAKQQEEEKGSNKDAPITCIANGQENCPNDFGCEAEEEEEEKEGRCKGANSPSPDIAHHLLQDLCCGLIPDDPTSLSATDHALELI